MDIGLFILIFWILPIVVGHLIGKPKNRAGWAWALFLGWIGVLIVALLSPKAAMTLDDLERRRNTVNPNYYEKKKAELLAARTHRECPHCREQMRRDASVCPHCQRDSTLWVLNEGQWWLSIDARWHWRNEQTDEWVPLAETSAATAATPNPA